MKTEIKLILMYLVTFLVISCTSAGIIEDKKVREVEISISASYNRTKASSPGSEEAVKDIQVLLFKDGKLYGSGSAEGSDVELMAAEGIYDIYVFVNDPYDWAGSSDMTEESILASRSMLSDNSMSSYVMFGYETSIMIKENTDMIKIPVTRFVSKVVLKEIKSDFSENPYFKGKTLEIKRIYLSNILGSCPYALKPEEDPSKDDIWFGRLGTEDIPEALKIFSSDDGLEIAVPDGVTESLSKVYYTYPNGCLSDSSSQSWSPRRTRLVLEAVLDERKCWYHITLPPMMPNVTYIINSCTIKNIGGMSPEEDPGASCEVELKSSLSWEDIYSVEEVS